MTWGTHSPRVILIDISFLVPCRQNRFLTSTEQGRCHQIMEKKDILRGEVRLHHKSNRVIRVLKKKIDIIKCLFRNNA